MIFDECAPNGRPTSDHNSLDAEIALHVDSPSDPYRQYYNLLKVTFSSDFQEMMRWDSPDCQKVPPSPPTAPSDQVASNHSSCLHCHGQNTTLEKEPLSSNTPPQISTCQHCSSGPHEPPTLSALIRDSLSSSSGASGGFVLQIVRNPDELLSIETDLLKGVRTPSICPSIEEDSLPPDFPSDALKRPQRSKSCLDSASKSKPGSAKKEKVLVKGARVFDSGREICPVCFEGFGKGGLVASLRKCNHHFHVKCINLWIENCDPKSRTCPLCKQLL